MSVTRRVFVSCPLDESLGTPEREFKWRLLDRINADGYVPELFFDGTGRSRVALGAWNHDAVLSVMRRCSGAVVLGFCRWPVRRDRRVLRFPSEYNHYEAAVSRTLGLPTLVVVERDVEQRGIFDPGTSFLVDYPTGAGASWLDDDRFRRPYGHWIRTELGGRRDVFLGYCGSSAAAAAGVKAELQHLGARVLDWQTDFVAASGILDQIVEAAQRCSAGVFLFTKDDKVSGVSAEAAPRDNVVFEAGYFANAKGPDRMLVILEDGAKMPADLGGKIFVPLHDRATVSGIREPLRRFLRAL